MRAILFVICILGAFSCAATFRDELKSGRFVLSLLVAAIGWGVGAICAMAFWRD